MILWMDTNVMNILDNISEDFFLKHLCSSVSLIVSFRVSGTVDTLLRRLCLLNKIAKIVWSRGIRALNQTI